MPALRHWNNVEVLMDETMRVSGDILFQAGTHCDAVRMRFDDWLALVNPQTGSFSVPIGSYPREEDYDWQDET
jgi:prolyl-tRNA editing enzyme YbaK/EbsC (Cys-tRNA(Pro) deacylase)